MSTVDYAFVFGVWGEASRVRVPNDFTYEFAQRNPAKYIPFMCLDPTQPGTLEEMDRCVEELGMRGIKIHPVMAEFDPSQDRFLPFFENARKHRLPFIVHMGVSPVARNPIKYAHPFGIDEVAGEFTDVRFVVAHLAQPWQREAAMMARKANVWCDVSTLGIRQYQGYDALLVWQEWKVLDKLLFGTAYPLWTPAEHEQTLRRLLAYGPERGLPPIDEGWLDRMLERDTLELLGVPRPAAASSSAS